MKIVERQESYINPFPVTAVANFYNNIQNSLIVETGAIKRTKEIVQNWIISNSDGITIAIQGEYGTGKTQLAIELRKYIRGYSENKYHFICLDNPSISFLEMYKNRFLNELSKMQVLERLEECYFDIVLSELENDDLYRGIIQRKRKLLKSVELIEQLGLPKSKYDRIFEKKLKSVTENARFVPALLLLMMPQFEDEMWEWFNGAEPSDALRERNVDFSMNSDTFALEAIGVFAFLFGQQGHRFVLFIDEMEKIVSNTEETKQESFEALKKLFETVKATKSMLILCGLPDYYDAFPKDAKQRVGFEIKTKAITLPEIKEYISNANKRYNGIESCFPFSDSLLNNILDFSKGNIRTIIRILYHSGNWYIDNKLDIDENALCVILKNAYGTFDTSNVSAVLNQIFISKGWLFEEKKIFKCDKKEMIIDYWIPSVLTKKDTIEKGIEVYIIQNVVSNDEYKIIDAKICKNTNNLKLLIVEGFISEKFYELLLKKVKHIMKFGANNFNELFVSVIENERARYENELNKDNLLITNEKIEQLSRIVNRAIVDINQNFIGKQEFYYFMKKFLDKENSTFYEIPDKDSEFYLTISEIQRVIESIRDLDIRKIDEYELGVLYFVREINYIIFYMAEEPQKMQISYSYRNVYEGCNQLLKIVQNIANNSGTFFYKKFKKYEFLLKYLCQTFELDERKKYVFREGRFINPFLEESYSKYNLLEASNRIKQVSQNFCAYILIDFPDVLDEYSNLFIHFYYFMYVIEPKIIHKGESTFSLEILREYYDLIKRYTRKHNNIISLESLSILFENYERELRRSRYER